MRPGEISGSRDETELFEMTEGMLQETTHEQEDALSVRLNRCHVTRQCCISCLAVAFAAGAAIFVYGIYTISVYDTASSSDLVVDPVLGEIIPLMLNLGITILTEALGLIHATSLRWNLMREGRLEFNANLRLLTASHRSIPNSWYCNLLHIIFLVLCYTSSSLVLVAQLSYGETLRLSGNGQADDFLGGDQVRLEVSGMALVTLGCGLLGQAFLAVWALYTTEVPTWSSSPISTALVHCQRGASRDHTQTMQSVGDLPSLTPSRPFAVQKSAFAAHRHIRRVLWVLWALVMFGGVWTIAVSAGAYNHHVAGCVTCGIYTGSGWWPVPGVGGPSPFVAVDLGAEGDSVGPVALIIVFALQASITLGVHCAELLVNTSRDEDVWRRTYKAGGYDSETYESIFVAAKSWKNVVLFLLKPAIHWLYGLGNTCLAGGILIMRPAQLMWMTLALLVLAVYGTSIARYRRTGPQPVAYGHVQTIVNLIDAWHEELYWGHKSEDREGVCHAGTSNTALPVICTDKMYL